LTQSDEKISDPETLIRLQNSQYYPIQPAIGKLSCSLNHLILVGNDGCVRLFSINEMLSSGDNIGKTIKAKISSKNIENLSIQKAQEYLEKVKTTEEANNFYEFYLKDTPTGSAGASSKGIKKGNGSNIAEKNKGKESLSWNQQQQSVASSKPAMIGGIRQTKKSQQYHNFMKNGKKNKDPHEERFEKILAKANSFSKKSEPLHLTTTKKKMNSTSRSSGVSSFQQFEGERNDKRTNNSLQSPSKLYSNIKKSSISTSSSQQLASQNEERFHSFVTGNNKLKKSSQSSAYRLEDETTSMPLFELASLTPKEKRVNYMKLQAFLIKHDTYPTKYRPLIWRFLLKLPENSSAFAHLGTFLDFFFCLMFLTMFSLSLSFSPVSSKRCSSML
jgi:hypothetical protein